METVIIVLTQGYVTLIDKDDEERVRNHKWCVSPNGHGSYYAVTRVYDKKTGKYKTLSLHRFIMNAIKGKLIDHRNGDGLDNRKSNLRYASYQENATNRQRANIGSLSGILGVSRVKCVGGYRYRPRMMINGVDRNFGTYATAAEAGAVRVKVKNFVEYRFLCGDKDVSIDSIRSHLGL